VVHTTPKDLNPALVAYPVAPGNEISGKNAKAQVGICNFSRADVTAP